MNWIVLSIVLLLAHKEYMASPTPMKLPGYTQRLTPFIRHWEEANFDRVQLHNAHQKHIEQKRHRRKRDLRTGEYGPANSIRLNFFAHDREFRLVLHQNPLSVFSSDVQIENTEGPIDYDISRIYTGSLEDDDNSNIHAILTNENLLDGTIETQTEHYYIEPAHRYSHELPKSGIHSIVYKLSDVISPDGKRASKSATATSEAENCASERLRNNMLFNEMKRRKIKDVTRTLSKRQKRWLPEEELATASDDRRNPPLPLDLDVPYNDDFSIFLYDKNRQNDVTQLKSTSTTTAPSSIHIKQSNQSHNNNHNKNNTNYKKSIEDDKEGQRNKEQATVITWRDTSTEFVNTKYINKSTIITKNINPINAPSLINSTTTTTTHNNNNNNNNIIVNNYNPNSDSHYSNNNYNINNNLRKTYTKHKNIIVSTYNNNNNNNNNDNRNGNSYNINNNNKNKNYNSNNYNQTFALFDDHFGEQSDDPDRYDHNSFFNSNWTTLFMDNIEQHRPSHKTHVEIITKNGATKKPNIIVNNYNPDIMVAPNFNSMLMTNLLSGRGNQDNSGNMGQMGNSARSMYDRKITCMLYLQADHTFFQKMGSDESSIEAITRHVQRANAIYKNTDFNNDGKPDNITFMIKRIKVHNMHAIKDPTYRFPGNYGVEKFLELFSEEDYDAFCLAYMFTYRDFEMGTLGLAWTGDLKNAGGVCEKNGHYRGSLKSLNTGIVTLLNYGKHVPPAVSHVTLAHEIGHNFGSPHDPEQCTPGGEDGNYIMFARATSGDKKNNNRFSPCSLKSIEPVLNSKARSPKGCFTEPQTSICGNGVVEQGEECDCGWEEDCKDSCCFPMSRHARLDEKPCTLTPRAMCSPSQGPCCTMDCKLKYGDKCRDDNGCRDPTFCDGHMPQCPPSINKPNKTICNKEFVCYMGECTGSICLAYGLESCQCIPGPQDDKIKSCELCCKLPGEDNPCRSSFEWNEPPFDVPDMFAKPGTPCNDYNGYCDVFQKCREVDPSGPLATLRKLLLSEESIATFKRWMQHNWYTVALAGVGVFVLLAISTKLMAKRSNLKLKSVTIIHSATTETVRLPEDNNGVIVHTAVRTKVPFKKKVRGERKSSKTAMNANSSNSKKLIKPGKSGLKFSANTSAQLRNSKVVTTNEQKKPPNKSKKNRVSNTAAASTLAAVGGSEKSANNNVEIKKVKKLRKHSKEIIDYSSRNGGGASGSNSHTNTFGKVQKWLLESPIVAQPLSHIDHSSRVRKVMSKSQSTPERLVQKSPQKTKSLGNLANEKVKLQVVYKPPFRFALRLSKNAKIKTHAVNTGMAGAVNKIKRPTRQEIKRQVGNVTATATEKTKRPALLIRGSTEEDNQILTLSEPNYETLNPKTAPSKLENPFYENLAYTQLNTGGDATKTSAAGARISHSSSKTNLEASSSKSQRQHSYSRSNSLTTSNNALSSNGTQRHSRRISETQASSPAHGNNFGSTQNLIQHSSSQSSNLAKSKKRSSLNLKSSLAKNGKDPPTSHITKRSNSNMNLRHNSSSNNMLPLSLPPDTENTAIHQCLTTQQSHPPTTQSTINQQATALSSYAAQRNSRASFSNIPRASLQAATAGNAVSNNNFSFVRQTSGNSAGMAEQRRSRSNVPQIMSQTSIGSNASVSTTSSSASSAATHVSSINAVDNATHTRINSMRQQLPHNYYAPPPLLPSNTTPPNEDREFAPNNEVNSDVENLVS